MTDAVVSSDPQAATASRCRVVLVCNPTAGGYSAKRLDGLHATLVQAGHDVAVEDSLQYRAVEGDDVRTLTCLVGGDGTARTVIALNQAVAHRGDYCLFPAGTVNLLAREARYGTDAAGLLARIAGSAMRLHHYGEIDGAPFLCCASAGVDSLVVDRVPAGMKRRFGKFAYVLALLGMAWRWPRPALEVTVDGTRHRAEAVFVCKGGYYAGPWVLDREADLCAAEFRVLLLPRSRRRDIARLFVSAVLGGRFAGADWIRLSGREIGIASDVPVPVQADGDVVTATPVQIRIAAEPLRFR